MAIYGIEYALILRKFIDEFHFISFHSVCLTRTSRNCFIFISLAFIDKVKASILVFCHALPLGRMHDRSLISVFATVEEFEIKIE